MSAPQTLKILFLAANPVNTPQLRLEQELRDVKIALRQSRYRDQFALQAVSAARINDMRQAMLDIEPQILHFSGHGEGGAIYLEDNAGNALPIGADALANFLTNFPSVQCVVLNACYSEDLGAALNTTVPFVVGMETAVEDEAAISFAVAFYDVLGAGGTYERAFRLAANALELEGKLAAANPVLVKSPTAGTVPAPIAGPIAGPGQARPNSAEAAPQSTPAQPGSPAAAQGARPSVTRLSGPQFKQFHAALLDAYTEADLEQMTRLEMNVNLDAVAGGSNLNSIAFNLIDWAQRTGRLGELIQAATTFVPGNSELQAFVASLQKVP